MNTKLPLFLLLTSFTSVLFSQGTGPGGISNANLTTRWKADIGITLTLGKISSWADQSGNGNTLSQITAANSPLSAVSAALNNQSVVRYTGTDDFTSALNGPNSNELTLFLAANGADYASLFRFQNTAGTYVVYPYTLGGNTFISSSDGGVAGGLTHGLVVNVNNVGAARYKKNIANGMQTYVNGAIFNQRASVNSVLPTQLFFSGIYNPGSSEKPTCDVGEMICYYRQLNDAEMNIVSNYLSAKYNVTFAAAVDFYIGDNSGNGNYDFEVAGLGRTASGNSLGASSSVTGGLEIVEGGTVFDNNEFLLYGHPTGNNAMNFFDIGGMSAGPLKARWDRIWYLDWTHVGGASENANLTFDLSDGGMAPVIPVAPLTNYKLLYRAGLAGNWTEIMSASSIGGDRVTFNSVPYTTADGYYTIGTLDNNSSPLPIELISFDAKACDKEICLEWSTASETINDYFTIEKSENGLDFEFVGKVDGAGNSNILLSYSLTDTKPYYGISYYRLKQTDYNGVNSYSALKAIDMISNSKNDFTFNIYPNPSNGEDIIVSLDLSKGEETLIVVHDINEKEVYSKTINSKSNGECEYSLNFLQKLPSGIYMISASSPQKISNKKIIIK